MDIICALPVTVTCLRHVASYAMQTSEPIRVSLRYSDAHSDYMEINVKKLQFIHTVNGDGSKTAKIIKKAMLTTLT